MGCEGNYAGDAPDRWLLGVAYGWFASELRFDNDVTPTISEQMVVVSAGRQFGRYTGVRLAAGAILGGELGHDGRVHDVDTGWLVTLAGSRQWTFGPGDRFFVTGSLSLGVSSTSTSERLAMDPDTLSLRAADLRLGALAGVTLLDRFSPYLLARAFGGPVLWQLDGQDIMGSDQHHYQLGVGASVRLPGNTNALVDASLLGERSVSISLGLAL